MKANEAPEKLYLSKNIYSTYLYQVPDPDDDTQVEYTRTDAFIEKACKFLKDRIEHDSIDYPMATKYLIEDFKKYMEDKL